MERHFAFLYNIMIRELFRHGYHDIFRKECRRFSMNQIREESIQCGICKRIAANMTAVFCVWILVILMIPVLLLSFLFLEAYSLIDALVRRLK